MEDQNEIRKIEDEFDTGLWIDDGLLDSITIRNCDKNYVSIESSNKEQRMLLYKNGAIELIKFLKSHFGIDEI